jgi:hypothetical protein
MTALPVTPAPPLADDARRVLRAALISCLRGTIGG